MAYRKPRGPIGDLGRAIHRIRKRLNLNQAELAAILLGADQTSVSHYEAAKLRPSPARLIRLLRLASEGERSVILGALEEQGVDATDLAPTAPSYSPTLVGSGSQPQVSGTPEEGES
jgi:transcriptional regulator with XRE-family HTH domain